MPGNLKSLDAAKYRSQQACLIQFIPFHQQGKFCCRRNVIAGKKGWFSWLIHYLLLNNISSINAFLVNSVKELAGNINADLQVKRAV